MTPTVFDEMFVLRRKVKTLDNLSEREVAYLVSFIDSFLEEFNSLAESTALRSTAWEQVPFSFRLQSRR